MVAGLATGLAAIVVLGALVAPDRADQLSMAAFLRVPVEALVGIALFVLLPRRVGRVLAGIAGAALGALLLLKILDIGFYSALARPFDLVLDWGLLDDAERVLADSVGKAGAVAAAAGAVVLVAGVLVGTTLAALRLNSVVSRHKAGATRSLAVVGVAWGACASLGVQLAPDLPVAADSATSVAYAHAREARDGMSDEHRFAEEASVDAFRDTPADQLLTGLRGKDVLLAFVESYGRSAIEDAQFAPRVDDLLAAGGARLTAAGFAARSGFLTSPTAGGGSRLAHATLLSGLWVDNQQRYHDFVSGDRFTLTGAFGKAGWRTVGLMPGVTQPWPEGAVYRYSKTYAAWDLGYKGPPYTLSSMPDQFTLARYEQLERGRKDRPPLMATVPLISSHVPFTPIPRLVDWNGLGDGRLYAPMARASDPADEIWRSQARVRTEYRRSIEYSLNTLISYLTTYGDSRTVLVFLGDHQPAPVVTGPDASRDVPVTIVAKDPAVLDRISGWDWQDGLKPGPDAPVWRMDTFRDRFLAAFGPTHPDS